MDGFNRQGAEFMEKHVGKAELLGGRMPAFESLRDAAANVERLRNFDWSYVIYFQLNHFAFEIMFYKYT